MSELQAFLGDQAIPELFNRLYGDAERLSGDIERLQRFVELTMAESSSAPAPAPAPNPEPSTPVPVEIDPDWMESRARQRLEDDAQKAAQQMVATFALLTKQGQSTATSLACALHVMREASAGFECPQTMVAILRALYAMDAAAREAQNNG